MTTAMLVGIIDGIMSAERGLGPSGPEAVRNTTIGTAGQEGINPEIEIASIELMFSRGNLPGVAEMAKAVDTADIANVADLDNEEQEPEFAVSPVLPSRFGGPKVEKINNADDGPPPEDGLFLKDPERWLREVHPKWDERRIQEEHLRIFVLWLLEWRDNAVEVHPDLKEVSPVFPPRPPRLLQEWARRQVT